MEVVNDDYEEDIFGSDLFSKEFFTREMSMATPNTPFIKDEPDDMQFNPNRFGTGQNGFDMNQNFGKGQFHGSHEGIDPSSLTMSNSTYMNSQPGSHMSSNYITNDELEDLNISDSGNQQFNGFGDQGNMQNGQFFDASHAGSVPMNQTASNMNIYSNTPEGAPIQSPYLHGFNYAQFMPQHLQQQRQNYSLGTPSGVQNGSYAQSRMPAALERQGSDSRSPLTGQAGLGNLHIRTPEPGSYPIINHRHQPSISSTQWGENTPQSSKSWLDSPTASPHGGTLHHPQISEVISSGKHASLPAKVNDHPSAYQTQEAKRKKRRESHNAVERRRRDNINERIHDLSRLVPQHRLEDEKVRKHIQNNGPLSPSISGSGITPPQATSLLAGGTGRRAAGNITTGLPMEDKDKGPNKGDILNGAVSWTRDLMWSMYLAYQREEQLKKIINDLGGNWPFEEQETDSRMKTELVTAVERNGADTFAYSRGPGSGLRVPGHTTVAGDPLTKGSSPQGLSPAIQSGGSGSNSGGNGQPQFWMNPHSSGNHDAFSLKEEDEYDMDLA